MSVWAIVPVKPLNRAKSRLAEVLLPEQREQLATSLLMRTVGLLLPLAQVQGVLVVSRDTKALAMVRDLGAQTLQESGAPELNAALYRATQALPAYGAAAVLVVPADLPLLTPEDIASVVHLGRLHNSVVIAPDRHEQGTNLLLVRPPGVIPYSFGLNSFAEHQRFARGAGVAVYTYRSPRSGLDLDTAEDLQRYHALAESLHAPLTEGTIWGDWVPVAPRPLSGG